MWVRQGVLLIGGLTDIGFVDDTPVLMVAGHQGRGAVDCRTCERVARDRDEDSREWFDDSTRSVLGIGPAEGQWVPVHGLSGGDGQATTSDGWQAQRHGDDVVLTRADEEQVLSAGGEELRAFGFSPDGDYFVLATPGDVSVFAHRP